MNTPTLTTSQESNAPWNEEEKTDRKFECTVSQTLSKDTVIYSNNYSDDEGSVITSDIPWNEEYSEQHYTPLELIAAFKRLLEKLREEGILRWRDYYHEFLKECDGWNEDELVVTD